MTAPLAAPTAHDLIDEYCAAVERLPWPKQRQRARNAFIVALAGELTAMYGGAAAFRHALALAQAEDVTG